MDIQQLLGSYIKLPHSTGGYGPETSRFVTDEWTDYTRPLTLNGWSYVEGDPINRTDPSGFYSCGFEAQLERIKYESQGWSNCKDLPDFVLNYLGSDPANRPLSYILWDAMQGYMTFLEVTYYSGGNLNGGIDMQRGNAILKIPTNGVPRATNFKSGNLSENEWVYVSSVAHEFIHISLQYVGQGTSWGEADAYEKQAALLEEWKKTAYWPQTLVRETMTAYKADPTYWPFAITSACFSILPGARNITESRAMFEKIAREQSSKYWEQPRDRLSP